MSGPRGRANMVVVGLLINGLFALSAIPLAPNKFAFALLTCLLYLAGSPIETAAGWRTWFYICIACVVVFVPFIFTMYGHWRPSAARAEFEDHEARVAEELNRMRPESAAA